MDERDWCLQGVLFFATGLFQYFKEDKVKVLILELVKRYIDGYLVFDSVENFGLKLMISKELKKYGNIQSRWIYL